MTSPRPGSRPRRPAAPWLGPALAAALAALAPAAAAAQTPAVERVEFDEAVRRAVERHPTIAQAAAAVSRAEALLQQAQAIRLPTVTATATSVTLDDDRGFSGGVTQPQTQGAFSASVALPILAPSRWAAIGQARDQVDVARHATAETRQQIAVAAAQAFLAVIAQQRQADVSARALEAARAHLDVAWKRLEAGAGSRLNHLRAAQAVANEEARLENARLALRRAQEALGVLLVADGPVDAGREPAFDAPPPDEDARGLAARPDVLRQTAARRAAERVVADSRRDLMPTATVSFDPQIIRPAGLFQPSRTWRLTFSITQVLFEGGQRHAVRRQRQVSFEQAALALTLIEIEARSEVRMARAAIEHLERQAASAKLAADQAAEVLAITRTAFELGATTNLEVIDAQRSARDAATGAALADDAVQRARLDLLVALGRFPR